MNVAILSDIHANSGALAAVLDQARAAGVARLLCCGDFIGYGHRPVQTLDLLEGWPLDACQGNHDAMDPEAARARYGSGAAIAAQTLSPARRAWLAALPHPCDLTVEGRTVRLCHGTPWNRDTYLYPDADSAALAQVAVGGFALVACGHSHYPLCRRVGTTWLVNPGSVGQQRHGVPGAHWALWDTTAGTVTPMVAAYDPAPAVADARQLDPGLPYLAEIHSRER